jgi:hypothetical protein
MLISCLLSVARGKVQLALRWVLVGMGHSCIMDQSSAGGLALVYSNVRERAKLPFHVSRRTIWDPECGLVGDFAVAVSPERNLSKKIMQA